MSNILKKLKGGDLRSIGKSDEVVKEILNNPSLFKNVLEGIADNDPLIRMRSADVIEKVSVKHPEYLQSFKSKLINEFAKIKQQEVRWHLAQMFSYIKVNKKERDKIIQILLSWINEEKSKIVKTFSLETLTCFAEKDEKIKQMIIKVIKDSIKAGSPAVISRGKKLLIRLGERE